MDVPIAKKSLGQHWLNDQASLQAICESAELGPGETVLEIGPGLGSLTKLLVKRAKQVTAVEFDAKLANELPKRVTAANLTVVSSDILSFDFTSLPPDYKIVANIPYYLTSNLIRVISETTNPPIAAILLVQKEVAERATAGAGQMSILSVTAQFYWEVSLGEIVLARLFSPPPKVDSQILVLKRPNTLLLPNVNPQEFFKLVKAGFSQRRKTLLNSLSSGLQIKRVSVQELLEKVALDPKRRPQTLSLEEWQKLYDVFYT